MVLPSCDRCHSGNDDAGAAATRPGEDTLQPRSTAFEPGEAIPTRHTADGADVSPPLSWATPPDETVELALICDDPDAPRDEPWVHWVLYGLPPDRTELPEAVPTDSELADFGGARQGRNDFDEIGYRGPAPPRDHDAHHYHFVVYALDEATGLAPGATKEELLEAMAGHVLAWGELIGTYDR
jgi:Raf kinase inhibitor-like YbhB/YbcL family protein